MNRKSNERREAARRVWMRERAVVRFYSLDNGRRSFPEILERIRRRWPRSAAGSDFEAKLRRIFDREAAARRAWYEERAQRWFRLRDPRWTLERLVVFIRNRKPALVKNADFLAELRRLYDADAAG